MQNKDLDSIKSPLTTQVAKVKKSTETDIKIINKEIFAYTLRRSFASNTLFNVVAVDKKGEYISVVETDLSFDDAADKVEELNMELEG